VLVVSAPAPVQRWRVLQRPGMTEERLRAILARQTPDAEKRRRADHVVHTALSRHHAQRQIRGILRGIGKGGAGPCRGGRPGARRRAWRMAGGKGRR
jgi:dephospho-CoA kinase